MGFLRSDSALICDGHCSEWAQKYMKYCLCSTRDWASLTLGLVSVLSWVVAEIPQIITNYKSKSAEGLSIAFLTTWIVGDFMNVFGCMLEPATLPTQYYTAVLYTVTTLTLCSQSIYYGYIYHRLKERQQYKRKMIENMRTGSHEGVKTKGDKDESASLGVVSEVTPSLPIPFPASARSLLQGELYYKDASTNTKIARGRPCSARSLVRSHTPAVDFFHVQRATTSFYDTNSAKEPLLGGHISRHSAPQSETKTLLCLVFTLTFFLSTYNLQFEKSARLHVALSKQYQGVVMRVGRKLLQGSDSILQETGNPESSGIGTFLGWGMAVIYLGGRLPQICLNIRRGNVQGLNPLMFIFALIGNATYVASILVESLDWSKIKPNLPWLVDSGGCVILDSFILLQFAYFRYRKWRSLDHKDGDSKETH